jgi:hypothetical protein
MNCTRLCDHPKFPLRRSCARLANVENKRPAVRPVRLIEVLGSQLLEKPLVFVMRADPKPNHRIVSKEANGAPVEIDARRVDG